MDKDYDLNNAYDLIDEISKKAENDRTQKLLSKRLRSLIYYFENAVAQVRLEEENISGHVNFKNYSAKTHNKYRDLQSKIISTGISAYGHMQACIQISKILNTNGPKDLDELFNKNSALLKDITNKRNKIEAHPEYNNHMVVSHHFWSTDGQIGFSVLNHDSPDNSEQIINSPREDLEKLRLFLTLLFFELARP